VTRVFTAGRGAYGCRRVAAALNREGHACSVGLVADLMRELSLRACQPRAYRRTTVPGTDPVESPDLIERDFTADQPGSSRGRGHLVEKQECEQRSPAIITPSHERVIRLPLPAQRCGLVIA
jgi:hypothetical protein